MGYFTIVWDNIVRDVVDNFVDRWPIAVIVLVDEYKPVFTNGVDNYIVNAPGLTLLACGVCDLVYAMLRLFSAGVVMGIYFSVAMFMIVWLYITGYRRWNLVMIYFQEALKAAKSDVIL